MRQLKAIILAAGEGSRMKSKKPKVLHEILKWKPDCSPFLGSLLSPSWWIM